jgi:muconolactone delta-isomerase
VEGVFSEVRAGVGVVASCQRSKGLEPAGGWVGKEQAKMQYLVAGEFIEPGPLLPPDQLAGMIRQAILPSHDVLINLKSEGKLIAGGYAVGERAAAFIFEVDSNEELDSLLQNLPYWGLVKMKVTPLQDIEGRRERDRQQADQIEQMLQR